MKIKVFGTVPVTVSVVVDLDITKEEIEAGYFD